MQPNDPRNQYPYPGDERQPAYPMNSTQMPDFMLDAPRPQQSRKFPLKLIIIIALVPLLIIAVLVIVLLSNSSNNNQAAPQASQATSDTGSEPYGIASNIKFDGIDWQPLEMKGWYTDFTSSSYMWRSIPTNATVELDVEQRNDATDDVSDRDATEKLLQTEYERAMSSGATVSEPRKTAVWVSTTTGKRVEFRLWEYDITHPEGGRTLIKRMVRVTRSHILTMTYGVDSNRYDEDEWNTVRSELQVAIMNNENEGGN